MRSLTSFVLATCVLGACVDAPTDDATGTVEVTLGGAANIPVLPSASGTGALSPWGGADPTRWRPEAVLANGMSAAMNDAWSLPDVKDVIVAVPVRLLQSDLYEFGDGQANAAPSFEWWHETRPPVIAALVHFGSSPDRVRFTFDRALALASGAFEIRYTVGTTARTATVTANRNAAGDWIADWPVPSELGWSSLLSTQSILVHPAGWSDWFPIWFRFPIRTIADLKTSAPAQTFTDGGSIVDHERVADAVNGGDGSTPFQRLSTHSFGGGYNQMPFNPQDIHAVFPWNGRNLVTAVGRGWTWVANTPTAPFKIMYTCFERRRADWEASAPDGGVPSGGGWHRIGDPAETILNDLESSPLLPASAMSLPVPASALPSGGFSYNLTDVATFRWLRPGEAFVTRRGSTAQPNFHWYLFGGSREVCTEEWVHACVPGDDYSMTCGGTNVYFVAQNATTVWGQNAYVVGDAPELGAWDPARAVPLTPSSYPTWTGKAVLPRNATFSFKLIKKDGSGNVVWESGANRVYTIPNGADLQVTVSWRP